jgi:hypothetical protein
MIRRLLLLTLGALAVGIAVASLGDLGRARSAGQEVQAAKRGFHARGLVAAGLAPGTTTAVEVDVENPYRYRIRVVPTQAAVLRNTNRAGCAGIPANAVVSARGVADVVIRGKSSATVTLHVSMPRTAARACRSATFSVAFAGRAVRASRTAR